MRHQHRILLGIATAIVLTVLYLLLSKNPNQSALDAYKKQLLAQGEKLTIAEIAPRVTADEQAGARDLTNAIAFPSLNFVDYPPAMKTIAPGRAMIAWKEETLPTSDSTNIWPSATRQVSDHRQDLANIRAALHNPNIRFDLDYKLSYVTPLSHLAKLKEAEIWLYTATLAELHEDHPTDAFEDLKSCVMLFRPLEREPEIISQLVHVALAQIALNTTWEALQYPVWQDAQLAELQAQWSSINFFEGTSSSLEMERAGMPLLYDLARASYTNCFFEMGGSLKPVEFGELLAHPSDNIQPFMDTLAHYPRYWEWKQNWSYQEELYNLQSTEAGLDFVRLIRNTGVFFPASKKLDMDLAAIANSFTNATNHFCFAEVGFVHNYLLRIANSEMERRMVVTAIALKRFQLRSGKYPAGLKELVPDYLRGVPADFMDGQPLRYHPNADGSFVLYSVGTDGEDNSGDPTPADPAASQNLYWLKGRDAVWPQPATPEETKAYKEKTLAQFVAHGRGIPGPVLKDTNSPSTNTN